MAACNLCQVIGHVRKRGKVPKYAHIFRKYTRRCGGKNIQSRKLVGSVCLRHLNETVFKSKVDRKLDKS